MPNEAAGGVPCTVLELLDVVIRLEGRSILVVEPLHVRRRDDKFEIGSVHDYRRYLASCAEVEVAREWTLVSELDSTDHLASYASERVIRPRRCRGAAM